MGALAAVACELGVVGRVAARVLGSVEGRPRSGGSGGGAREEAGFRGSARHEGGGRVRWSRRVAGGGRC